VLNLHFDFSDQSVNEQEYMLHLDYEVYQQPSLGPQFIVLLTNCNRLKIDKIRAIFDSISHYTNYNTLLKTGTIAMAISHYDHGQLARGYSGGSNGRLLRVATVAHSSDGRGDIIHPSLVESAIVMGLLMSSRLSLLNRKQFTYSF
jgi:hypothetical protein